MGQKLLLLKGFSDEAADKIGIIHEEERLRNLGLNPEDILSMDLFALMRGETALPNLEEIAAVWIGGSPESILKVGEAELSRMKIVLAAIRTARVHIFAVCFGWQLLAKALGGTVGEANPREFGFKGIKPLQAGHWLFDGLGDAEVFVPTVHNDAVLGLPEGFEALSDPNDPSGIQVASREEDGCIKVGIQGHPEMSYPDVMRISGFCQIPDEQMLNTSRGDHLVAESIAQNFLRRAGFDLAKQNVDASETLISTWAQVA